MTEFRDRFDKHPSPGIQAAIEVVAQRRKFWDGPGDKINGPDDVLVEELDRVLFELRALPAPQPAEPQDDTAALRTAAAMFASVIKSGEPWTADCQRVYDAAFPDR